MPDFAACLDLGLQPVGLVQGFCVMRWGWYGAGSGYMRGMNPYAPGPQSSGGYAETYRCPHGFVSSEHRMWGQNVEQTWVEEAWSEGYGSAYGRMLDEAESLGAHGVIGVVDRVNHLADTGTTEFHFLGTAIKVDGRPAPGRRGAVDHLPGRSAADQVDRGRIHAGRRRGHHGLGAGVGLLHDRVPDGGEPGLGRPHVPLRGRAGEQGAHGGAATGPQAGAPAARRATRLHGARIEVVNRELSQGDEVIDCTLRGNRMRRFKDFDVVPPPRPTVRLT